MIGETMEDEEILKMIGETLEEEIHIIREEEDAADVEETTAIYR